MKRNLLVLAVVSLLALSWRGHAATPPAKPADYSLAAPMPETDRAYLGLATGATNFHLEDIRCELLVVDCFDMYCHICQAGAKHVNELYRLVQERGLGSRVKFVGLGAGDTPLEVQTYREKFKVSFPVFPDRRSLILKQFGELKLPNLIILRSRGGKLEVVQRRPGPIAEPAKILADIEAHLAQRTPASSSRTAQATEPTCEPGSPCCRNPGLLSEDTFKPAQAGR